ncbi:hypothetical protein, partial [Faecalibacillus faecis]|uniref:hypothetical protein n=1 Tax=Faecalibacillus faecis TaxID=1982628 RepID=UPI00386A2444
ENEQEEVSKNDIAYDFTSENIDSSLFPFFTFKKICSDIISNNSSIWITKSPKQGDVKLKEVISNYLYQTKGIDVKTGNIIIISSLEEALDIIFNLVDIKEVGIEQYSYLKVNQYFKKKNLKINYYSTDNEGLIIDNKKLDLVYTIPYNQFPLGIKMSLKRKNQLLSSNIRYILEDDFDCDLINKHKIETVLYSLDNTRVFYYGCFSHIICPGLRISYLIIPSHLKEKYNKIYNHSSSSISTLDQNILAQFIKNGHFYRHLHNLKKVNDEKKKLIENYLKDINYIKFTSNKLSFLIEITKPCDYSKLKDELVKNSIKIRFLEDYSINKQNKTIVLSYYAIKYDKLNDSLNQLFKVINNSLL